MLASIVHILPLTTVHRERVLPVPGRVLVRQGQTVQPRDPNPNGAHLFLVDSGPEALFLSVLLLLRFGFRGQKCRAFPIRTPGIRAHPGFVGQHPDRFAAVAGNNIQPGFGIVAALGTE